MSCNCGKDVKGAWSAVKWNEGKVMVKCECIIFPSHDLVKKKTRRFRRLFNKIPPLQEIMGRCAFVHLTSPWSIFMRYFSQPIISKMVTSPVTFCDTICMEYTYRIIERQCSCINLLWLYWKTDFESMVLQWSPRAPSFHLLLAISFRTTYKSMSFCQKSA
jgi:hypothetical protein